MCSQMSFPAAISLWNSRHYRRNALAFFMGLCCYTSSHNDYRYIIATTGEEKKKKGTGRNSTKHNIYMCAFSLFHLICPSHSVNLCQLVDCQFGDTFLERSPRVFAAGPLSVAPSNTATNWNVVQLWESSQDLN